MEQFNVDELKVIANLIQNKNDNDIVQDVIHSEDMLDDGNEVRQIQQGDLMSLLHSKYDFSTIKSRQQFMADFIATNDNNRKNSDLMFCIFLKILAGKGYINEDIKKQILITYDNFDNKNEKLTIFKNLIYAFPWGILKQVNTDTVYIENRLNSRLYGMQTAKEKVIEHIVLSTYAKRPVPEPLLLHGPPGVGKTSFAMAIADAMGLPLIKISFAGNHDVSVFSGSAAHWSNSTPGMIVKEFAGAGCLNPVVLVDEIDKSGGSSVGRTIDILAELLNPEQSRTFKDLFLCVPVDLSHAFYVCCANDIEKIPWFIKDRCETIFVPGYSINERKEITKQHITKQIAEKYGLNFGITIDDSAAETLATVESLRRVKRIIRSGVARCLKNGSAGRVVIKNEDVMHEFINPKWFEEEDVKQCDM